MSEGGTVNLSGSTLEGGTHVLLLDEEALFAEAVSVSGEEEYWQAVAEGAQAIRLEGTFELESDIDQMCPVILSEGQFRDLPRVGERQAGVHLAWERISPFPLRRMDRKLSG